MNEEKLSLLGNQGGHSLGNIIFIFALSALYILAVTFNGLSGSGSSSLFRSSVGEISNKYELDVTPAGWTFSIWGIIYFAIAATLIFYVFTIFKKNDYGYIYTSPVVVSPAYCTVYSINFICNIGWIFLWDREMLASASYVEWGIVFTNILSLAILIKNIEQDDHRLKEDQPKVYWTYIILAYNGQATYTTWTIIAGLINFTACLAYDDNVDMQTSSLLYLSLLLIILLFWATLDFEFLDEFTRFLITPYLVVIWGIGGTISKKGSDPEVSDMTKHYLYGLICLAGILLVLKSCIMIFRQVKKPFNTTYENK